MSIVCKKAWHKRSDFIYVENTVKLDNRSTSLCAVRKLYVCLTCVRVMDFIVMLAGIWKKYHTTSEWVCFSLYKLAYYIYFLSVITVAILSWTQSQSDEEKIHWQRKMIAENGTILFFWPGPAALFTSLSWSRFSYVISSFKLLWLNVCYLKGEQIR